MKLLVKNTRGKTFDLDLPETSLVEDLKKAITDIAHVNIEEQKLIFGANRRLNNSKSLQEYGIKEGDTVVLLPVRSPPPPKFDLEPIPTRRSILEATSIYKTKDKPIRTAQSRRTQLGDLLGSLTGFGGMPSTPPAPSGPPQLPDIKPEVLKQITDMGFPESRAKKALYLSNMNVGGAMDWLLEHGDDPDADSPLTPQQISQISRVHRLFAPRVPPPQTTFTPDQSAIQRLKDMGFSEEDSIAALKATNNDPDAATAWLLGEREEETGGTEIPIPLNSPLLQMALTNPRVLAALRNVLQDPSNITTYLADPEIGPVLLQLWSSVQRGN